MGRKLNLGHLSESECEHILEVVHKDFNLRYMEKERLRQIEEDVQQEETKYTVLSKSHSFTDKNCVCCFSRFLILFNPRILCDFCKFKVCKNCIHLDVETQKRCCEACLKQRQLKKQSNDWFYSSVEKKFKRCGSAKVIRSLYKRRLVEGSASALDVECACGVSPCHIHCAPPSAGSDDEIHSTEEGSRFQTVSSNREDSTSRGSAGEIQDGEGTTSIGPPADQTYAFQTQTNRGAVTSLRTDTSIQTDWEQTSVEAETMTTSEETSRCFSGGFDGMATVSTEGSEVDPQFTTRPHNVRVLEGEPLKVECKVNGTEPLDVLWFCNRNQVQQLQENERCEIRRQGNAFSLTLYEMRARDSLEYLCIAVNALGQCAQGFTVTVDENAHSLKSPEFTDLSDIEIVPEGSDAALRCRVSAYPEPKITWYKNNRQLMLQGGRYRMDRHQPQAFHYALVVEAVKGDDSGTYGVVARNLAGEARHAIQLLVQPNLSESARLQSPSSLSSICFGSSEDDILRLAEGVSRTQGRYKTTASRMLRSADMMSSMQSQLDEMDKALQGLEGEVLEVIIDEDDDDDDDDDANNNCRILDEFDDMESSAEAVGMVTSAALQLLSSAKELALKTVKDDEREQEQEPDRKEEEEEQQDSDGGEEDEDDDDEEADDCVDAEDLCLSYQELEQLFQVGLITRTQLKNRLVQKRNIKHIRSYLQSAISGTLNDASGLVSGNHLSEESVTADAMDTSADSIDTKNGNVHDCRKNKSNRCRQELHGDKSKGQMTIPDAEHENLLKKTEQQIYMTSGKVFSLEDYIRDLERQVLEVDETTSTERLATLENNVARAVARVTQSDQEVNEIERQIGHWMTNSNKNKKGCSGNSTSSSSSLHQHQKLTSSKNQRQEVEESDVKQN